MLGIFRSVQVKALVVAALDIRLVKGHGFPFGATINHMVPVCTLLVPGSPVVVGVVDDVRHRLQARDLPVAYGKGRKVPNGVIFRSQPAGDRFHFCPSRHRLCPRSMGLLQNHGFATDPFVRSIPPSRLAPCHLPLHKGGFWPGAFFNVVL